jgi:hypothetical protein
MPNLILSLMVVVQVIMAVLLGVLVVRNGRNGRNNSSEATYVVASESSHIVKLASDAQAPSKDVELYRGIPFDEHLLELDKKALEESYRSHLVKLWAVWLSDGARNSANIKNGLRISRESYHQAAQEIQRRERQISQEKEENR